MRILISFSSIAICHTQPDYNLCLLSFDSVVSIKVRASRNIKIANVFLHPVQDFAWESNKACIKMDKPPVVYRFSGNVIE